MKSAIIQELKELNSPLANMPAGDTYAVPAGYFDGLAAVILKRIHALEAANATDELQYLSPVLASASKELPYTIPVDYFDTLPGKVLDQVHQEQLSAVEETAALSPLLAGLKKQMPYEVPAGYFEQLEDNVSQQTSSGAKVVPFIKRRWFRYAAAAVVTGGIVLAGLLYFNRPEENAGKVLAEFTADIKSMNDTQKDKVLDIIDTDLDGKETAQVNTKEVQNLLKDVTPEELTEFQQQTEDIENVLMTN